MTIIVHINIRSIKKVMHINQLVIVEVDTYNDSGKMTPFDTQ